VDDAALVWLLSADTIRVTVADAAPCIVRPAALLREWVAVPRRDLDGTDPWHDYRYLLLAVYPELVGRN
jgi:hypothetical protein